MKKTAAFLIAVLASFGVLFFAQVFFENVVAKEYRDGFKLDLTNHKFKSVVLQKLAAGKGDLMLYGSSEFEASIGYSTHPYVFFNQFSGLQVNLFGKAGYHSLVHTADFGSLGDTLKGRKVVFFLSPQWFTKEGLDSNTFDSCSSVLQIFGLLFNPNLSDETKRAFAARYAAISEKDSHEAFGMAENFCSMYAKTGWANDTKRFALTPFYWTQYQMLVLKDDVKSWLYLRNASSTSVTTEDAFAPAGQDIDWNAVLQQARAEAAARSNNNVFGMENNAYDGVSQAANSKAYSDTLRISPFNQSPEYEDFKLLLDVCREEGIKPLIVSVPVNGKWYDFEGVGRQERQAYYDAVRAMVQGYGFELADFSGYEYEDYFLNDPYHLGWVGWVYVDQAVTNYFNEN
ncbi:MAG: D-alanyl-lipoteichoic acid biosynthesis protein DltD [Eubacteriales bacterium]